MAHKTAYFFDMDVDAVAERDGLPPAYPRTPVKIEPEDHRQKNEDRNHSQRKLARKVAPDEVI
jgi:hypothetical protein